MEQNNTDLMEQFQQNNGMSIEEAYTHVQDWFQAEKYKEALEGCAEIMRYDANYKDIARLQKESQAKLIETEQQTTVPPPQQTTLEEAPAQQTNKTFAKNSKEEILPVGKDEKFLASIGYLSFLCLLPLLLKRDSVYCKHHGKQGLVLAIVFFLYQFIGIFAFIPFLEGIVRFFVSIGLLLRLVIIIFAMLQAFRGSMWKMPVIYKMSQSIKI